MVLNTSTHAQSLNHTYVRTLLRILAMEEEPEQLGEEELKKAQVID